MTFATTLGRGLGYTAALAGHALCATSTSTANFALDVAAGAADGYVDHAERLAAKRAARNAERGLIAIAVVPGAKRVAKA